MGEQGGTNRSRLGSRGSFERVGPLTLQREETREQEGGKKTRREQEEIRGRFCVFVLGKGLVAKVQRASLFVKGSPFPAFFLLLLMTEGGGIIVLFRCLINDMLLVIAYICALMSCTFFVCFAFSTLYIEIHLESLKKMAFNQY